VPFTVLQGIEECYGWFGSLPAIIAFVSAAVIVSLYQYHVPSNGGHSILLAVLLLARKTTFTTTKNQRK